MSEMLRATNSFVNDPVSLKPKLRNPDGPEAADLLASMKEALEEIRELDFAEVSVDPDWPRRIARNALNGEKA